MRALLDGKYGPVLIFLCALVVPGSGFVLLGKPARGLMYVVWIVFFALLTFKAAAPGVSLPGKLAGGLAVWALSLVELARLLKHRRQKEEPDA